MIIDSHVHISLYKNNAKDLKSVLKLLIDNMNDNGVRYAIVIPDNIEGNNHIANLDTAIKLTRGNKRLFFLGSPQIIQRGDTEIEKYRELLNNKTIHGIKLFPGHDPYYPTDERCSGYYNLSQKLNVPVVFHTGENSSNPGVSKYNDPKYIVEVAQKYPRLKVIITHYYWPQIDYCYKVTKSIPNIYFELAATADDEVLEKSGGIKKMQDVLTKTINDRPDKVIYGTDWPMCKMENHIELIESLDLSNAVKESIYFTNAVNAYKLDISEQ